MNKKYLLIFLALIFISINQQNIKSDIKSPSISGAHSIQPLKSIIKKYKNKYNAKNIGKLKDAIDGMPDNAQKEAISVLHSYDIYKDKDNVFQIKKELMQEQQNKQKQDNIDAYRNDISTIEHLYHKYYKNNNKTMEKIDKGKDIDTKLQASNEALDSLSKLITFIEKFLNNQNYSELINKQEREYYEKYIKTLLQAKQEIFDLKLAIALKQEELYFKSLSGIDENINGYNSEANNFNDLSQKFYLDYKDLDKDLVNTKGIDNKFEILNEALSQLNKISDSIKRILNDKRYNNLISKDKKDYYISHLKTVEDNINHILNKKSTIALNKK